MSTTSDRNDPRLTHGADSEPVPQAEVYLVLSEEERAKGFVRPLRLAYRHVGTPAPEWPLRDLTEDESERYAGQGYVAYEEYPPGDGGVLGRFWTQAKIDGAGKGCGAVTFMSRDIAETFARQPIGFYGATYCANCRMHLKVGPHGEFTWVDRDGRDTAERVGS